MMDTRPATLVRASDLLSRDVSVSSDEEPSPSRWRLTNLAGRLTEITGSARLSSLAGIMREAQVHGGGAAWICVTGSLFFPPDFEQRGIRVSDIPIVMLTAQSGSGEVNPGDKAAKAGEILLKSNAFSLVVMDLGSHRPGIAALGRMLRIAGVHGCAVVALTDGEPALGSLTGLRVVAEHVRTECETGAITLSITAVKDKQAGPFWRETEVCRAPHGLC
ncbi:MAG: hypothetical protein ACLFM0_02195 [Spirochaetales bacterium]